MLLAAAKEHGVWIVGGSIPEEARGGGGDASDGDASDGDAGDAARVFNTAVVAGPDGEVAAVHRKVKQQINSRLHRRGGRTETDKSEGGAQEHG